MVITTDVKKIFRLCFLHAFSFFLFYTTGLAQEKVDFTAREMEFDEKIGSGAQRLLDDVVFEHGGAKMYCDSAYYYTKLNSLDAYNNVYINQGDTLHLYGDYLHYDGNTKLARVRDNVKLINKETTLLSDALDFDLGSNVGYYVDSALILNKDNRLRSEEGYYYTKTDIFLFKDSVVVINPDYTIYSDTMKFNTETEIAYFFGPTEIVSEKNYIYCEKGWYNTLTDISELKQNAYMLSEDQEIYGDSLYYERKTGYGRARNNVQIIDEEQDILLFGDFAEYFEDPELSMLTGKALFVQAGEEDSTYVHADTLRSSIDTAGYKQIRAYYRVKLFKTNMQGKCDSMSYSYRDSVIRLYTDPVLWSDEHQLSADYIQIHTVDRQVDRITMEGSSFIISEEDTSKYNQIKGKDMFCHFKSGQLHRIDVNGNGETVYYPNDEGEIIGVNKATSSNLVIRLKEGKVDDITFLEKPDAVLYPLKLAPPEGLILKDFHWLDDCRPKNKMDVFIWQE